MARAVDEAMAAERPEKQTVRKLWVEEVARVDATSSPADVPLYLTMPGAAGKDIALLVENGILELEENEAVKDPEEIRIVAIESSPLASVTLNRRFPGIKILATDLRSILKAENMLNFPETPIRPLFRARIVNLDLDAPLVAEVKNGLLHFPVLALVHKLAHLHADPPVDWTLCLTLHSDVIWKGASASRACDFLLANFERDAEFAAQARETLGQELYDAVVQRQVKALKEQEADALQRVLMVLVPKRIAFDAHRLGWSVDTVENLRYGGSGERAPMVTWMLRFEWDERASTDADSIYGDALQRILARCGHITAAGALRRG